MAGDIKLHSASGGSVTLVPDDSLTTDETVTFPAGGFLGGLGMTGETWVNEIANREADVVYTNDSNKPIMVSITQRNETNNVNFNAIVDGVSLFTSYGTRYGSVCFIVPAGSSYSVNDYTDSSTIHFWAELK